MKKITLYIFEAIPAKSFMACLLVFISALSVWGGKIILPLQTSEQNYTICAQQYGEDTLIVYAPLSLQGQSPVWYLGSDSVAAGDFLLLPALAHYNLQISLKDLNTQQVLLFQLKINYSFAGISPYPLYQSGGVWHSGHDTLWKCSDLINLGMIVPLCARCTDESGTEYAWIGPAGQISNTTVATIENEGLYYIQYSNDCYSVNVDSFVVVNQPYKAPLWSDTTFCNDNVNLDLDCGTGWKTILWNNGLNTQIFHADTAGIYAVQLSSACTTVTSSVHVFKVEMPDPSFASQQSGAMLCADSIVTLDPNPGYLYNSYSWNTGDITSQLLVAGNSGQYSVTVSKQACHLQASVALHFFGHPLENNLCFVTFDNTTGKNKIAWKSEQGQTQDTIQRLPVDYFNIYVSRPGTGWTLLSVIQAGNWNEFIDQFSAPVTGYNKYKIAAQDQCGALGDFSVDMSSIYLQAYQTGTSGNIKLEWNHCYSDNSVLLPLKYYIYKGINSQNLQLYDSIPGTENEYFEFNANVSDYYQVCGLFGNNCNTSGADIRMYSNVYISPINSVENINNNFCSLYPNPARDFINLKDFDGCHFILYNSYGQIVKNDCINNAKVDTRSLAVGFYYLEINSGDRLFRFRFEKQ